MKEKEVLENLKSHGLRLHNRIKPLLKDFCKEMEERHYGVEETAYAFLWFETGWLSAKSRLEE